MEDRKNGKRKRVKKKKIRRKRVENVERKRKLIINRRKRGKEKSER